MPAREPQLVKKTETSCPRPPLPLTPLLVARQLGFKRGCKLSLGFDVRKANRLQLASKLQLAKSETT